MPPTVPFARVLHQGNAGKDVVATKRALSRAGFMEWGTFTSLAGPNWEEALKAFQKAKKLHVDGVYGTATHTALKATHRKGSTTQWAFDATAIYDIRQEIAALQTSPEDKVREAIVAAGFYWYAHRNSIAYSQFRPFQMEKPPGVPSRWDCSAFVTNCHYAGGAPNPNRRAWDGLGYTGTLLDGGTRCTEAELKPGDLVFYGFTTSPSSAFPYGSPTHVALYTGHSGSTPMVLSMGGYPMAYLPVGYRDINSFRTYRVV